VVIVPTVVTVFDVAVVSKVPVVGNVTLVVPDTLNVTLPPEILSVLVLATPVPP
jgi:hypothetical protein